MTMRPTCSCRLAALALSAAAHAQLPAPLVLSLTAQLDGQSETRRLALPAQASATEPHVTLLERTQSYDTGGSMPRAEWEQRFAAGLPDDTIPLGCDASACRFVRHQWAKTGVDVTLRPLAGSGEFQPLSIAVTLHRFLPAPDGETPASIDTWRRNLDTSLRVGDSRTIDLDARGTLTIERLDAP
ncbi:hypothetical protein [Ralstonia pseudosolanacearum]|uniref:Putative signal peptide protein n=1 Tax=Ralstonia solanacearum TaxID=305 RepID=A0A0S4WFX2_RALSL|nr:hypothetical protein [Ralstonia pseudosolanacearum]CUV45683.1 putative signal peptide protein [Ralstonia solanacearum]MDO3522516.1 hypothetical protein [Ralstonia pseudosolanacearum]MDO3546050.1 hypothetical protein [Ralstonia pseudosolanacearum]MDO3553860.1 hypothetical protein [Ralstonia pseudosolanacearum]MDO3568194.1 hypothetical protein [Ralstonia pseudosolanacearum]